MRITIELPDELLQHVTIRAAEEDLQTEELIKRYIEQGLQQEPLSSPSPQHQRSQFRVARAATGRSLPDLSNAELYQILEDEDSEAGGARDG
jgi:hypothetical protein